MAFNILGQFKGDPWPYQAEDGNKIVRHKRMILGHKTGLGKTFISLYALCKAKDLRRVIIVATNSALPVWMDEIPKWSEVGSNLVYVSKDTPNKESVWKTITHKDFSGVVLINHTQFRILTQWLQEVHGLHYKKPVWDAIIVDEAHKLKSRTSQLYDAVNAHKSEWLLFLTATPASRGAQDMWAYLHLLDPKYFPSYWQFVNTFCFVVESGWGKDVFGTRNASALKKTLERYYVSRKYGDVKKDMPPLRRQLIHVEMEPVQEKLYNQMNDNDLLPTNNGLIVAPGTLALMTRLRQLALCPQVFSPELPIGAGVRYIIDDLMSFDPEERHTVIFSEYKEVLKVIEMAVQNYITKDVFFLKGGMSPEQIKEQIDGWKKTRGVMFCVLACAQSFALDTGHIAYVLGASCDPIVNIQAEGRLKRGDSNLPPEGVLIKYIIPTGTREENTRQILNEKVGTVKNFLEDFGAS